MGQVTIPRVYNRLKDKVAVVTGAAKGIGRAIASVLSAEGARVFILDADREAGERSAESLRNLGRTVSFVHCDVTSLDSLLQAADEVEKTSSRLDILCCNAGIYPSAMLEQMSEADWDRVQNVNLKGMFLTIKAFLPLLKKAAPGSRIVLTSSITGPITGYPGWTHYASTKAGMLGFMRSAALELAPYSITINAVLPGNILTEGLEGAGEDYLAQMTAAVPLKRLGKPEEVAYAVLFLASDEASFITGQTLVIDGGQILPESREAIL